MFILFTGYCWNGTSHPREKFLCSKLSTLKIRSLKNKNRSFDTRLPSLFRFIIHFFNLWESIVALKYYLIIVSYYFQEGRNTVLNASPRRNTWKSPFYNFREKQKIQKLRRIYKLTHVNRRVYYTHYRPDHRCQFWRL